MKLTSTGVADKEDFLLLEELEKKLLVQPQNYDTLLRKALLLHYPFLSTDQAEEVFEFIEIIYPNTYETNFWRGTMLFIYVAHCEKAIELLSKAISIDGNRADAYILLGQALNRVGGHSEQEIEKLFRTALQLEPYWPNAWYGLIYSLMRQKRYVDAREVIQEAFQHIPTDYVESDDIIQERHDELVSGRDWTSLMEEDMRKYLQDIDKQEAEETKELEVKKTI